MGLTILNGLIQYFGVRDINNDTCGLKKNLVKETKTELSKKYAEKCQCEK